MKITLEDGLRLNTETYDQFLSEHVVSAVKFQHNAEAKCTKQIQIFQ